MHLNATSQNDLNTFNQFINDFKGSVAAQNNQSCSAVKYILFVNFRVDKWQFQKHAKSIYGFNIRKS